MGIHHGFRPQGNNDYVFGPPVSGYIAWYQASSWTGTQWTDNSGYGNHVTTIAGTITSTTNAIGNGSSKAITTLQGNTSASMVFPVGILPSTYTLFHVARFTGGTRGRIFTGSNSNLWYWLSGFWNNTAGVAYHSGWITPQSDIHGNNWLYSTDQNSLYRSNATTRGSSGAGSPSFARLGINTFEFSDWQVAEVIVYNTTLNATDYGLVESYLSTKYGL